MLIMVYSKLANHRFVSHLSQTSVLGQEGLAGHTGHRSMKDGRTILRMRGKFYSIVPREEKRVYLNSQGNKKRTN